MIRAGALWLVKPDSDQFEDTGVVGRIILKWTLKDIMWKGSVQGQVAGSCEHGNKLSVGDAVNFLTN
jgi:hypothetical protein